MSYNDIIFRLEYNMTGHPWNFDDFTHKPNTHSWNTLCPYIRYEDANIFTEEMDQKYFNNPNITKPSIKTMQYEFDVWAAKRAKTINHIIDSKLYVKN